MARIDITLFGRFHVKVNGQPVNFRTRKVQALLLILLAEPDLPHNRDRLLALLWPEDSQAIAQRNLRQALYHLRKALPSEPEATILSDRQALWINPDAEMAADSIQFKQHHTVVTHHAHDDIRHCAVCCERLETAVELYAGDFASGFYLSSSVAFEQWLTAQQTAFRKQAYDALATLTAAYLIAGHLPRAERSAQRQIALDDLHESAYQQLMEALALGGRRDEALLVYDQCRERLWNELGVAPNPRTRALEAQISDGTLVGSIPYVSLEQSAEARNPYKGLQAFGEEDAGDFFGRTEFVKQVIERLQKESFLAIVGPSGSGKSSAVRAGVIPAIRCGGLDGTAYWAIAIMTPGSQPLESLDAVLAKSDAAQSRLLFVDQLEELYTLTPDKDVHVRFLQRLVELTRSDATRVVVTLRADFYDRPLAQTDIGRIFRDGTLVILPLSADEMADAIRQPASGVGVRVEPGLMATIIADVNDQPGALPLLQYTLTEIFDQRADGLLTRSGYTAIGGVSGATGRRAESIFSELDEAQQPTTRQIFLRLVTARSDSTQQRRRIARNELVGLAPAEDVDEILNAFGRYRLLTFGTGAFHKDRTVEIAHEALLHAWPRLESWIRTAHDDLRQQQQLHRQANAWLAAKRDESFLLHGSRLVVMESWAEQSSVALTATESAYLDESIAARNAQLNAEMARQEQERALESRSRRFLQILAVVMLVMTIGALAVSTVVWQQRNTISAERDRTADSLALAVAAQATSEVDRSAAQSSAREALEAYSLAVAAAAQQALNQGNNVTALALAHTAAQIESPPQAVLNTLREAAFAPGAQRRWLTADLFNNSQPPSHVAITPDGANLLLGFVDGDLLLWNWQEDRIEQRLSGHAGAITTVAVAPDGEKLFSADEYGNIVVWNRTNGAQVATFNSPTGSTNALGVSSDGKMVVAAGSSNGRDLLARGMMTVWDIASGTPLGTLDDEHRSAIESVAFTLDGQRIIAASGRTNYVEAIGNDLILWDIASQQPVHSFETSDHDNRVIALHPDGASFFTGSTDHNIYHYDIASGTSLGVFDGHDDRITALAVTFDGKRMLSATDSGTLFIWDVDSAEIIARLNLHEGLVNDVVVHPDGNIAFSISVDNSLVAWDIDGIGDATQFRGHNAPVLDVGFLPDGSHFVTSSGRMTADAAIADDNTLILWDSVTGQQVQRLEGHSDSVFQFEIAPDGQTMVSSSYDQTLRVWDTASGTELDRIWAGVIPVSLAYAPGNPTVAVGGLDGSLALHAVGEHGNRRTIVGGNQWPVWAVDFSQDGSQLLSGSDDGIRLYDVATGDEIAHWTDHSETVTAIAFSPDSATALSSGNESVLYLWDVESGTVIDSYPGHQGVRTRLAFLPDGEHFVSTGWDGNIVVRNVATGEVVRSLSGHDSTFIMDVAVSPDGTRAASAGVDGSAIVWDIATIGDETLPVWIDANRYVRELSCAERALYSDKSCAEFGR
jgi:WD40 repeat protein/DNA-binding SARP family transcriptional activator